MQRDPPGPTLAPTGGGKQTIEPFGWQFAGHQLQPGRNRLNDWDIELGSAQVNENRFNTAAGEGILQGGRRAERQAQRAGGPMPRGGPSGCSRSQASASISVARATCRRSVALSVASPRCRILLAAIGKASSIWHISKTAARTASFKESLAARPQASPRPHLR